MNYTVQTIFNEFRHCYFDGKCHSKTVEFLTKYYDLVKSLPTPIIRSMLPIDFHGFGGSYLEDWMIQDIAPTENYPFSIRGQIYDWYGDRTTSDIFTSVANTPDELYQRMLIQYMLYLSSYLEVKEAKNELHRINDKLTKYSVICERIDFYSEKVREERMKVEAEMSRTQAKKYLDELRRKPFR